MLIFKKKDKEIKIEPPKYEFEVNITEKEIEYFISCQNINNAANYNTIVYEIMDALISDFYIFTTRSKVWIIKKLSRI